VSSFLPSAALSPRAPLFRSTAWFAAPLWAPAGLALIEPLCKLLLPLAGVYDEVVPWSPLFAEDGTMNHPPIHTLQHVLMYVSILCSGFTDLAARHFPGAPPAGLPAGLDGLVLVGGFVSQALIMQFHLSGPQLDVRLHTLLLLATYAAAATIAAALLRPSSSLAALCRCVALLTLGSFYCTTGDLIYRRPAFDSVEGAAIAPVIFLLHASAWTAFVVGAVLVVLQLSRGGAEHSAAHAHAEEAQCAAEQGCGAACAAGGKPCRPACAAKVED
jgi:hypothetical protein